MIEIPTDDVVFIEFQLDLTGVPKDAVPFVDTDLEGRTWGVYAYKAPRVPEFPDSSSTENSAPGWEVDPWAGPIMGQVELRYRRDGDVGYYALVAKKEQS